MVTDTNTTSSGVPSVKEPVPPEGAPQEAATNSQAPAKGQNIAAGWWWAALGFVALAAGASVAVARGTYLTTAHRTAAAGTALLVVVALALVAQAVLLWYQGRAGMAPGRGVPGMNVAFRRRGLKAAVIGQDGRASTSKTQVVLWTAAVVWALVDLLLLARAYPGGKLFINAVATNWRPEYLVLLGLPAAAATTAKAAVANANNGYGPVAEASDELVSSLGLSRVYVRGSLPDEVRGFVTGIAELLTGDDGTVAWADLQYVVFTLITLVYFAAEFLAQPANGLPAVPAALLTLMGVSAATYAANKVVNTRGANPKKAAAA